MKKYANFLWRHLHDEENELLPVAEKHLETADWDEIASAFSENVDPLAGASKSEFFDTLYRDILQRTPAPLGFGNN